mgnify:CR=1 FL=1
MKFRDLYSIDLASGFNDVRDSTIKLFERFESALDDNLFVERRKEINLPLWEFSHIGWFSERWLLRNKYLSFDERRPKAWKNCLYGESILKQADELFNSATIPHEERWLVTLPKKQEVKEYLLQTKVKILDLIKRNYPSSNEDCYFYRLCLAHEMMHIEALRMTAQTLGLFLPEVAVSFLQEPSAGERRKILISAHDVFKNEEISGFRFDNEINESHGPSSDFRIDSHPTSIAEFLDFIKSGEYENEKNWSEDGKNWLKDYKSLNKYQHTSLSDKLALAVKCGKENEAEITIEWFGKVLRIGKQLPVFNINYFEAEAYVNSKSRELPTENQWLAASKNQFFQWGSVWEWTSSIFKKDKKFKAHPYKEYSEPWFGDHMVLKGSSFATYRSLKCSRYRNFYMPHRQDIFAGFRTVEII